MNDKILDIVSKHTIGVPRAKTLEELAKLENDTVEKLHSLFVLNGVVVRSELLANDKCDDACKFYCTKGGTEYPECCK